MLYLIIISEQVPKVTANCDHYFKKTISELNLELSISGLELCTLLDKHH